MLRVAVILGVGVGLVLLGAGDLAAEDLAPVEPERARADLAAYEKVLRRPAKKSDAALLDGLRAVLRAYGNFARPEAPDADPGALAKMHHEQVVRRIAKVERQHAAASRELILKTLRIEEIDRQRRRNTRTPFLVRALAELQRLVDRLPREARASIGSGLIRLLRTLE